MRIHCKKAGYSCRGERWLPKVPRPPGIWEGGKRRRRDRFGGGPALACLDTGEGLSSGGGLRIC